VTSISKEFDLSRRARFYFLLATSKNFKGFLPKTKYVYYALFEIMITEVKMMDKMNITVILVSF